MDGNIELISAPGCSALAAVSLGNEGVPGSAAQFNALREVIDTLPAGRRRPLLVGACACVRACERVCIDVRVHACVPKLSSSLRSDRAGQLLSRLGYIRTC
jgi:hypothetical protein